MPDDDYLPRGLPHGWRAVRQALLDGDDLAKLTKYTERALAATLRGIGGVPSILDASDELHRRARKRWEGSRQSEFGGSVPAPRRGDPQGDVLRKEVDVLLETRAAECAADAEAAKRLLASGVVRRIAWQYGFGRILPRMVARSRWEAAALRQRCEEVLDQPGVDKLACALLRHPDGKVRAPGHPRVATKALLEISVSDL